MVIGILLYCLVLCAAFINLKQRDFRINIILFIMLFLISTFRYNVGTDYLSYLLAGFDSDYTHHYERFSFIYKFIYDIGNAIDFKYFFFVVTSFIYVLFIYILCKINHKIKEEIILTSILSAFFFISLNIVRQTISISAALIAITYLYKIKKKNMFLFWAVLSISLHSATILLFITLPFIRIFNKFNKRELFILLAILTFMSPLLVSKFITLIHSSPLPDQIKNQFHGFLVKDSLTHYLERIANLAVIYAILYHYKFESKIEEKTFSVFYMGAFYKTFIPGLASRLILPFSFTIILISSNIISRINQNNVEFKSKYKFVKISTYIYLFSKFISYILFNIGDILPYRTWIFMEVFK